MPTNRTRRTRGWSLGLDDYRRQELLEGPGAALLAGVGYYPQVNAHELDHLPALVQAAARAEMLRDWDLHRTALIAWWTGLAEDAERRRPWRYPRAGGPGTRPWAWWEFDAPETRRDDEAEDEYLDRHGLWLTGERGLLITKPAKAAQ
jgi:hypothetical protein